MIIDLTEVRLRLKTRQPTWVEQWWCLSLLGYDIWRKTMNMTAQEFVNWMETNPLAKTFVFAWVAKQMQHEYNPTMDVHMWLEAVYATCMSILKTISTPEGGEHPMAQVIPFPRRDK